MCKDNITTTFSHASSYVIAMLNSNIVVSSKCYLYKYTVGRYYKSPLQWY